MPEEVHQDEHWEADEDSQDVEPPVIALLGFHGAMPPRSI